MSTLWHGRFAGGPAEELLAYSASLSFDQRLWPDDLEGSRAHVRGLARANILTSAERDAVLVALDQVESELSANSFVFGAADEDIHTAVERRVTELAGAAGAKLHTGRSPNDQVATDLRLYTKRSLREVAGRILVLQHVLLDQAIAGEMPTCRGTPISNGRNRCCWPITSWPMDGRWRAMWIASSTVTGAPTCHPWALAP